MDVTVCQVWQQVQQGREWRVSSPACSSRGLAQPRERRDRGEGSDRRPEVCRQSARLWPYRRSRGRRHECCRPRRSDHPSGCPCLTSPAPASGRVTWVMCCENTDGDISAFLWYGPRQPGNRRYSWHEWILLMQGCGAQCIRCQRVTPASDWKLTTNTRPALHLSLSSALSQHQAAPETRVRLTVCHQDHCRHPVAGLCHLPCSHPAWIYFYSGFVSVSVFVLSHCRLLAVYQCTLFYFSRLFRCLLWALSKLARYLLIGQHNSWEALIGYKLFPLTESEFSLHAPHSRTLSV